MNLPLRLVLLASVVAGSLQAQTFHHDDFIGPKLQSQWTWSDPGNDCSYQLLGKTGKLRMSVPPGNDHTTGHAAPLYAGPMLVMPASGDFTITTHVTVSYPQSPSAMESGLMIWKDKSNNLQFKRTNAYNSQNVLFYGNIANAQTTFHGQKTVSANQLYLRVKRAGSTFQSFYGTDGQNWQLAGTVTWPVTGTLQVGISTTYWLWWGSGTSPAIGDYEFFDLQLAGKTRLITESAGFSASTQTSIGLKLGMGSPQAGRIYLVLGSLSGSQPGITLPGSVNLPLNFDAMTSLMLQLPGLAGVFPGTVGILGTKGEASAKVILPPNVLGSSSGGSLRFAAVSFPSGPGAWTTTNAAVLAILP